MKISSFFSLFLCLCLLRAPVIAHAQSVAPGEQRLGYTREVLFSIPAGHKSQNISVFWQPSEESPDGSGVCGLRVCNGRIYLGDAGNKAVKVFSLQGRFLTRTPQKLSGLQGKGINIPFHYNFPSQGILTALRTLVVNQKNEIFTLSGIDYDVVSKFSPSGRLLWCMGTADVLGNRPKDHFGALLYPAPKGGVAVPIDRYNAQPPQNRLAWLDKEGKLVKIVNADWCDEKGFYTFEKAPQNPLYTGTLRAFNGEGQTLFTRQMNITPEIKALFSGALMRTYDGLQSIRSSVGNTFYSTSTVILAKRFDIHPNNNPQAYNTGLYAIVIPYDSSGQPLGAVRFLEPPFSDFDTPIAMDEHGDIYTVEYVPNKVRVVRYRRNKTTGKR